MKTTLTNAFLIFSFLFLTASFTFAQSTETDWNAVKRIQPRTDLFVKPFFGKTILGEFVSANDDEIQIFVKNAGVTMRRDEIKTIHFAVPRSNKRGKTVGFLFGALAGAALGVFLDKDAVSESDHNYSRSVLLTATGGASGYFIGRSLSKDRKKGICLFRRSK